MLYVHVSAPVPSSHGWHVSSKHVFGVTVLSVDQTGVFHVARLVIAAQFVVHAGFVVPVFVLPGSHGVQILDPIEPAYEPWAHAVWAVFAVPKAKYPISAIVQAWFPIEPLYVPAAHGSHARVAALSVYPASHSHVAVNDTLPIVVYLYFVSALV